MTATARCCTLIHISRFFENSGKVVELDRYVMREAFASVRKWIDMGWKVVPVSINLSRMHFYESNVADNIYNEFRRYNIPVEYVELELTESLFLRIQTQL